MRFKSDVLTYACFCLPLHSKKKNKDTALNLYVQLLVVGSNSDKKRNAMMQLNLAPPLSVPIAIDKDDADTRGSAETMDTTGSRNGICANGSRIPVPIQEPNQR